MTRSQLKKTILALLLTTACTGFIVACGSNEPSTPQGRVVKGPVVGATVTDSSNPPKTFTTDKNGNFPLTGTAPYFSTGGTYFPLVVVNGVGTVSTTPLPAPPLVSYGSSSQITPLTTLVAGSTNPTQMLATLTGEGVDLNTDLSTSTSTNTVALTLSEAVGAAMQQALNDGVSPSDIANIIVPALANAVSNLTIAPVTAAINAAVVTDPALASVSQNIINTANAQATAAATLPVNTVIPPPINTGATGSTGS